MTADKDNHTLYANSNDRVFGVILAAGRASRYGGLKQIERIGDTCLLGIVVGNALDCEELENVILVLGHEAGKVIEALGRIADHERLKIAINGDYEKGMSTSLRLGLRVASASGCDAAAFILGDMPFIDSGILSSVITAYRFSSSKLCCTESDGRFGHPVVAGRDLFSELLNVEGDIGGREILRKYADSVLKITIKEKNAVSQFDVNTREDMKAFLSIYRRSGHS